MAKIYNELRNYQNIPRELVFDKTLSDRARFVYVFMACKPDGWNFFLEPMSKDIGYSIDTLRKYLNELVASGWLVKSEQTNEKGVFGAVEYTLKATKFTDTENFRHGKKTAQENTDNKNTDNNKEEDTNVSPKKIDYQAVFDCWNKYNGKKIRKVTQFTDARKKAIKKMLDIHNISQEVLMRFFASLPFADQWLFHPTGTHKLWKPTLDWWMTNTKGWLTKGLEGGVHLENPQAFERIMKDGTFSSQSVMYLPQGRTIWFNEETKSYWSDDNFYYESISDGYEDDNRPDGATLTLNNARGNIKWNAQTKKWEKV